ncbi:AMP-binding protein [Breznakiellaceae bacterium SP9]
MSTIAAKYVNKFDFTSYEDFYQNFTIKAPENFNFAYDVMDELAKTQPFGRALVWCDERGAEATFTYADLKRLSDSAANVLADAGVKKGTVIMLILQRRWEYWPILLALHKLGAIAIPATHLLTTKDIVYRCKAADVYGIISIDDEEVMLHIDEAQMQLGKNPYGNTDTQFALKIFVRSVHVKKDLDIIGRSIKAFPNQLTSWNDFKAKLETASPEFVRPLNVNTNDSIMLLYFTSGTTGMPKMVQHNFLYPLGHISTAYYWQQVRVDGLHLTVSETGWAKAAWGKIYGQWLCGTGVFVYDFNRFVPKNMLEIIAKYKLTTFCAPPTIYRFFIKEDLTKYDFFSLYNCSVAGEPLNPEIFEEFKKATGLKLRECYGQTELTVTVCTYPWLEPKPGSMGKPSPGYDIDLLNLDGKPCKMGEEGEIVVRTDKIRPHGMFGGYYRDKELTDSVWADNVYHTGDMAWRDEDGYLWFVGRADDVIKSSGYRIGPFEVESALHEHPSVLECAITGIPDADRGFVVKATVVLVKGYEPTDALKVELQNHVKKTTAPYKYPRIIEFVTELPKTISGKIRRVQIREGDGVGN